MKTLFKRFLAIIFVLGIYFNANAQQIFLPLPEAKRPHMKAEFTNEKITINGKDDEAVWQRSEIATHFTVAYPKQGNKATYDTEVKLLYDNSNIYLFVKCDFPPGKKNLQVQNMRRDFGFTDNELFEVVVDPFKDPRLPVMAFCVTPYGTQMDIMHYADGTYDYKWDAVWKAASQVQEHSWTTEIAIPFSTLRYPKNAKEWSINFLRNIRQIGELSGWSPWPMAFNESRMEYGGILTNIKAPAEKINIRFEPYTLISGNAASSTPNKYKAQAGGEIKYAINTNTILEGTINTDFAQADADVQVVNLTRSSVFFPEKRQFFLENSSLFSIGQNGIIQPFFSRRIGLSDNGAPLTINGGLRLIHQDGKQSAGLLIMKQDGDSTENGALFSVLRYKRNISKSFVLGGMAVLRENLASPQQASYLNPVGAVDAFWRVSQPLFIRGMGSVSGNTLTHQKGSAFFSEVNYGTNTLGFDWFESGVSKGYQAQTGYVARDNFINTQPNVSVTIHKNWFPKNVAFYYAQLSADIYHEASTGTLQEANVVFTPFMLIFNNLAQASINITSSSEYLTEDFSPVRNINIAAGNYHFNRYELYGFTNLGAPFSAEARVSTGEYYNGNLNSYYLSLRAAPSPHAELVVTYTRNDFKNTGTASTSATTHLLAPGLRLAASPKLLLSTFYQYNTNARNGSLNARLSWEYKPLSFIYLVYNNLNNYYHTPFEIPQKQQSGILKLTYIYQL
ncbi:MAG: DUF5916 domain-containing protein [Bacteroidota bacterium]